MIESYCCEDMRYHLTYRCPEHDDPFSCPDHILIYAEETDTYGIPIRDGGQSFIRIRFCPWCGRKL